MGPLGQRKEFVRGYQRGLHAMTERAERYTISRKTGYALVRRVEECGVTGLQPRRKRSPSTHPGLVDPTT